MEAAFNQLIANDQSTYNVYYTELELQLLNKKRTKATSNYDSCASCSRQIALEKHNITTKQEWRYETCQDCALVHLIHNYVGYITQILISLALAKVPMKKSSIKFHLEKNLEA